jgi:anti-sigma factor RsiW
MNCKTVRPLLSAYLDRELDGNASLDVREHVHRCPECEAELNGLRDVKRMLERLPDAEPPADLEERLLRSVRTMRAPEPSRRPRAFAGYLALAAGAAALTLVSLRTKPDPAPETIRAEETIAFEIDRNQLYEGTDLGGGISVLDTGNGPR